MDTLEQQLEDALHRIAALEKELAITYSELERMASYFPVAGLATAMTPREERQTGKVEAMLRDYWPATAAQES